MHPVAPFWSYLCSAANSIFYPFLLISLQNVCNHSLISHYSLSAWAAVQTMTLFYWDIQPAVQRSESASVRNTQSGKRVLMWHRPDCVRAAKPKEPLFKLLARVRKHWETLLTGHLSKYCCPVVNPVNEKVWTSKQKDRKRALTERNHLAAWRALVEVGLIGSLTCLNSANIDSYSVLLPHNLGKVVRLDCTKTHRCEFSITWCVYRHRSSRPSSSDEFSFVLLNPDAGLRIWQHKMLDSSWWGRTFRNCHSIQQKLRSIYHQTLWRKDAVLIKDASVVRTFPESANFLSNFRHWLFKKGLLSLMVLRHT